MRRINIHIDWSCSTIHIRDQEEGQVKVTSFEVTKSIFNKIPEYNHIRSKISQYLPEEYQRRG